MCDQKNKHPHSFLMSLFRPAKVFEADKEVQPIQVVRPSQLKNKHGASEEKNDSKIELNDSVIEYANIHEFFVDYKDYHTSEENERQLRPRHNWWRSSKYKPNDVSKCSTMDVDEQLIWRILNSERHILISGKAGSGKSHLLERFVANLEGTTHSFAICAPTGIAAYNVGGETLHRRLGLGLAKDDRVSLFNMVKKNQRKYARTWKFLTTVDILIIDEISMVNPELFTTLDYLFRQARNSTKTFGGVRLICVGDFTQLGPVDKDNPDPSASTFVLDTEAWKRMEMSRIFLDRSFRQKDGDPFLDLLNEVRIGNISDKSMDLLMSRIDADVTVTTIVSENPTEPPQHEQLKQWTRVEANCPCSNRKCLTIPNQEEPDSESFTQNFMYFNGAIYCCEQCFAQLEQFLASIVKPTLNKVYKLDPIDLFPYKKQVETCNQLHLSLLISQQKVEKKEFHPSLRVSKREHILEMDPKDYEQGLYMIGQGKPQLMEQFPLFHLTLAEGAQVMMRNTTLIDQGLMM